MANHKDTKTKPDPVVERSVTSERPSHAPDTQNNAARAPDVSSPSDVAAFVNKLKSITPVAGAERGRLVFAMDATMSRQPTWDMALAVQAEMFEAVRDVGGLDVQLIYFRGSRQCRASKWVSQPDALKRLMMSVACQGGLTQLGKVLTHVRTQADQKKVNAVVFVGDAMEEDIDSVCARAGDLGLLGVPVFIFQEGYNAQAETAFREIARLTKGSWCRFEAGAAGELRALLEAVAVYAAGGRKALQALGHQKAHHGARLLLADMTTRD